MISLLAQAAQVPANADPEATFLIWGLILVGATVGFLLLELFVPSGGLIGVLSGISAIGSIVSFFKYDQTVGVVALGLYLFLGPLAIFYGFKFWLNSPLGKRIVLGGTVTNPNPDENSPEFTGSEGVQASEYARKQRMDEMRSLIGAEGITITALRPVGTVKIAGRRVDALAETGVIEAKIPIIVTDVYDNQIKVRPAGE